MKFTTIFTILAGSALAADFGKTCRDEHLDPATDVITASCDIGDGHGTLKSTSLDLNTCFGFSDNKIQYTPEGHFGDACHDCIAYRLPDPIYYVFNVTRVWMNCSCNSAPGETSINLDKTPVENKFGNLVCA